MYSFKLDLTCPPKSQVMNVITGLLMCGEYLNSPKSTPTVLRGISLTPISTVLK